MGTPAKETKTPPIGEEVLIGHCDVDSGQILLCDPCYIKDGFNSEEWNPGDDGRLTYNGCCGVTLNTEGDTPSAGQLRHELGHPGAGVVTSSGYGDGSYPVYATYADEGDWGIRVASVRIDFLVGSDEGEELE